MAGSRPEACVVLVSGGSAVAWAAEDAEVRHVVLAARVHRDGHDVVHL